MSLLGDADDKYVDLQVPNGRKYQIKATNEVKRTLCDIEYFQKFKKLEPSVHELVTPHPKKLNYFAMARSLSFIENYIPDHRSSIIMPAKIEKVHRRRDSYIKD